MLEELEAECGGEGGEGGEGEGEGGEGEGGGVKGDSGGTSLGKRVVGGAKRTVSAEEGLGDEGGESSDGGGSEEDSRPAKRTRSASAAAAAKTSSANPSAANASSAAAAALGGVYLERRTGKIAISAPLQKAANKGATRSVGGEWGGADWGDETAPPPTAKDCASGVTGGVARAGGEAIEITTSVPEHFLAQQKGPSLPSPPSTEGQKRAGVAKPAKQRTRSKKGAAEAAAAEAEAEAAVDGLVDGASLLVPTRTQQVRPTPKPKLIPTRLLPPTLRGPPESNVLASFSWPCPLHPPPLNAPPP